MWQAQFSIKKKKLKKIKIKSDCIYSGHSQYKSLSLWVETKLSSAPTEIPSLS